MMKRFLLFTLLISGFHLSAQIEKNTIMAGGSVSFDQYRSYSGYKSTRLNINPNAGYFLARNFVLGSGFEFVSAQSTVTATYYYFYISPFARYYVKNLYLQAKFDYGRYDSKNITELGFDLGYAIFLNKNVALEPAFYYDYNFRYKSKNLGFKMGIQVYFNRN